jgi:transposase
MITTETRAEICRLIKAEHFTVTKTAKTLGIHHSTVKNVIESEGKVPTITRAKKSALDPYAGFIQQKLQDYPDLHASTMWRMLKDRGYQGAEPTVRKRLQHLRGARPKKAYLPITVFPGEEAQVDWAHFGTMQVGKTQRKLSCFVMVLSYSRALFARFFFDQTIDSFLNGHIQAFTYFGGIPRQLRYDNLKSVVAERFGQTIRFNPQLLELAAYYAFKPSVCNPYSGHEKGRVERAVRYIRENFFIGKNYSTIDKLNSALALWLTDVAEQRTWPDDRQKKVSEIWEDEKSRLISLPAEVFSARFERPVRSGKIPFIRFDKNDYSIPFELVGQPLSLSADEGEVIISRGGSHVARHPRSFSGGEKIIIQEHFAGLLAIRPGAQTVAARSLLTALIPDACPLFSLMTERGLALGPAAAKLIELLRTYGHAVLAQAIKQAVERDYGEVNYLTRVCDQIAKDKGAGKPTLPVDLPDHTPGATLTVIPHDASTYDELTT